MLVQEDEIAMRPMSTAGRAGNAALLIAGMIILFFVTSVFLISGIRTSQYLTLPYAANYVASALVIYGIGATLLFFWWKTRPAEGDD